MSGAEDILVRSLFKELREEDMISVQWADDYPYILFVLGKKILSAVRNRILEWSIVLEENGIIGEGVSFTEKEKNVAQTTPTIVNYTNNFYSNVDNTQIQQGGRGNEICRYGKAWKK